MYTTFDFSYFDSITQSIYEISVEIFEQQQSVGSAYTCDSDLDYYGYIDIGSITIYDENGNEDVIEALTERQLTELILREWELSKTSYDDFEEVWDYE